MNISWWFDLEGTIITNWNDPCAKFHDLVREFIRINHIEEINIFSFAIYNQRDVEIFDNSLRSWLQRELGAEIKDVVTVEEIVRLRTIFIK